MARRRSRAAARKRFSNDANGIGLGVRNVAAEIAATVTPAALWWTAPLMYVAEGMAAKAVETGRAPADRVEDLSVYFMAGLQEIVHAAFGEFDPEHFAAWLAALEEREGASG